MPWARASELDRVLLCAGSTFLPVEDLRSDRTREAADWGTMVHRWKATGEIYDQPGRNMVPLFLDRLGLTGILREEWWPGGVACEHEVTYGYSCLSDTVERYDGEDPDDWKATRPADWVTGTCDYVHRWGSGSLWVDDLKTGRFPPDPDSAQMKFYTSCALMDHTWANDARMTITHWPRYPKHKLPTRSDPFAIDRHGARRFLNGLRDKYYDRGELATGDQCTFCPSRNFCEAYADGANQSAGEYE